MDESRLQAELEKHLLPHDPARPYCHSPSCFANEILAQSALDNGVSRGALDAFAPVDARACGHARRRVRSESCR
jgi:hypothetical protein